MVQAASIKWAIGGLIDASASGTIKTDVGSFVLAYIGNTSGSGVDAATFSTEIAKPKSSYSIEDEGTWGNFFAGETRGWTKTKTLTTTGDTTGDTYQVFYKKDGNYFLVNDAVATIMVSVDGAGAASTTSYFNGDAGGATLYATGSARNTITSVPEPSVALMGLLGLGMLLKRRKA